MIPVSDSGSAFWLLDVSSGARGHGSTGGLAFAKELGLQKVHMEGDSQIRG